MLFHLSDFFWNAFFFCYLINHTIESSTCKSCEGEAVTLSQLVSIQVLKILLFIDLYWILVGPKLIILMTLDWSQVANIVKRQINGSSEKVYKMNSLTTKDIYPWTIILLFGGNCLKWILHMAIKRLFSCLFFCF